MKKSLLIAALAVFTMVSCSKDQVVETPQETIAFNVVANKATKAADVYCNANPMSEFAVWASYGGESYFADERVAVSVSEGTTTCTPDVVRYWPAFDKSQTMTFFALAGTTTDLDWTEKGVTAPTVAYTIKDAVAEQEDVLFARSATFDDKSSAPVAMNFRHALSLIEFKAKNESDNLHVVISNVCATGVKKSGTFTFPTNPTTQNFQKHDDNSTDEDNTYNTDKKWETSGENNGEYVVALANNVSVPKDKTTYKSLTYLAAEDGTTANYYSRSMLLMPQATDTKVAGDEIYIGVYCQIYNMAGNTYVEATDALLYKGWALVPIDINWEMGKKYIYTFLFKNGNGGTQGGDDPKDPKPGTDPVLFQIDYTVSVDDFDLILDQEVEMVKK